MGLFDPAERYLKNAAASRVSKGNTNLKVVCPIIKLKVQQFKQESLNMEFNEKKSELTKILKIIQQKIQEVKEPEIRSEIKALALK